jgi:UDP-N-acetylmuramate-alanine ligase
MRSAHSIEGFNRIHMVGAGGAGMSGLAKILAGLGYDVTGQNPRSARRRRHRDMGGPQTGADERA